MKTAIQLGLIGLLLASPALAQDRDTKVRTDRAQFEKDANWIYNDLDKGLATAKESGKPVLVVFR